MNRPERIREVLGDLVEREGGAPAGWAERLALFLERLESRNRQVNLVSRQTAAQSLERHVLPSLAALLVVPPESHVHVIDVGSGGGFPGVPLAILRPQARLDFVEATRKKCDFLSECVEALELEDACVHWCRVEAPTEALVARSPFDVLLARAVGSHELLGQAAEQLLGRQGSAWCFGSEGSLLWRDMGGAVLTTLQSLEAGEGV